MRFEPHRVPLITYEVASYLLNLRHSKHGSAKVSLDLGISYEKVSITKEGITIRGNLIYWETLDIIKDRPRDIYALDKGDVRPLCINDRHFYKLVNLGLGKPPTIEIDAIFMHRIKGLTPMDDAKSKVLLLGGVRCKNVLDTCTGLGYTAISALNKGACKIVTVEIDENVLKLARYNPYSRPLSDKRIEIVQGDVANVIEGFNNHFNAIIHDPPRISLAGDLYSKDFYAKMYKALRRGGRAVHYVGEPGIKRGVKVYVGVLRRMREVGFLASYDPATKSVVAKKI